MHALRPPLPLLRRLLALVFAASLAACSIAPKAPEFSGAGTVQSIREVREPTTLACRLFAHASASANVQHACIDEFRLTNVRGPSVDWATWARCC